ncbi:MAG TPA: T9SS type A sorting domain-containing protein [Bacteroidia bacterium]
MIKKLCIILIVIASINEKAQAQPFVLIPDVNFANYLGVLIPAAMHGDSLNTTSTLVTTMTSLNVSGRSIANLSGVQYFTSLIDLDCSSNSLTSLPTLSNALNQLSCEHNALTTLPALPSSLTQLDCGANSLASLPTLPNSLTSLSCYQNSLTSLLPLPTSLIHLWCNYNSLTSLPSLPNSLTLLGCDHNNITCFPTFPTSITYTNNFGIDPNPYNCLPNHILGMSSTDLAKPLCAAGNSNGCAVAGIQQVAGINEQVTVYPNPASTSINVTLRQAQGTTASIEIYNTIGERVYSSPVGGGKDGALAINVSDLAEGVYTISITTNVGVVNKRVVIVR